MDNNFTLCCWKLIDHTVLYKKPLFVFINEMKRTMEGRQV